MKGSRLATVVALGVALGLCGGARALTDEEVFRTFRFNFANPGGRALAMGGAFIGIADDATAAAANPAGLTNLVAPEFFIEMRLSDATTTSIVGAVDDPRGFPGEITTSATADADNILHPSFISFVKPFDHWVFGISRQELLNTNVDVANALEDRKVVPPARVVEAAGNIETLLESYNASFAFRGGEKFAAGVTLSYARLDVESVSANLFDFGSGLVPDYSTTIDDTDEDFSWAAGLLWKPWQKFHLGAVYVDGPEFELDEAILAQHLAGNYPSAPVLADFLGNRNAALTPSGNFAPAMFDDPLSFTNHFAVPDRYGLGLGFRPTLSFTIAVDVTRVEYSDLEDGFVGNVNALTFPGDALDCDFSVQLPDGSFPCDYTTPIATYQFDDETIYRLGMEYVWLIHEKTPLALRWGAYNDPNVRLRSDFSADGVFVSSNETFPEGDEEIHYTVGFGFVLQDKFQADFAADFSDLENVYIASFIYHF
jgi:long-subunit fatty acid transport protein